MRHGRTPGVELPHPVYSKRPPPKQGSSSGDVDHVGENGLLTHNRVGQLDQDVAKGSGESQPEELATVAAEVVENLGYQTQVARPLNQHQNEENHGQVQMLKQIIRIHTVP